LTDNPAEAQTQYATRAGDVEQDRDSVLAIWRGNLGDDTRAPAKYAWFYQQPEAGTPLLQLLSANGQRVGVCAAGRRRMLRNGQPLQAGVLVDLAVLPEHRSLGPALILQQGLAANALRELGLLYGFPNSKAAVVLKRAGYRPLGELVRRVRVLRHRHYLARHLPRFLAIPAVTVTGGWLLDTLAWIRDAIRDPDAASVRVQWRDQADPEMQTLWEGSVKPDGVVAVRDLAHLRWRFDRSPIPGVRYALLYDPKSNALIAWFATQTKGTALFLHDYWSKHGPAIGTRYLAALVRAARATGHASVYVELATTPTYLAPWQTLGFVARDARAIYGCWNDAAFNPQSDTLHLTAADEDE